MTTYRAQIRIPTDSMIPADDVTNTFHFRNEGAGPLVDEATDVLTMQGRLETFYEGIDDFLGITARSPASVKYYDLSDAKPRAPIASDELVLDLGDATDSMPHEVAITGSYRAAVASGVDPTHRRGRVYIGPIRRAYVVMSAGGHFLSDANAQALADLLFDLLTVNTGGIVGCVYSETWHLGRGPTAGGPTRPPKPAIAAHTLAEASFPVVATSCDNAFDTQRRRGNKATKRIVGA